MLMPSIFNNNLFDDDWFGFPFYGYADKAENRAEKMPEITMNSKWKCLELKKKTSKQN